MQWHDFIFSEHRRHKALRHLAFWGMWWVYFLACYTLIQQPFEDKMKPSHVLLGHYLPLKTFLLILMYAAACYPVIYYLLPQLIKRNWIKASVNAVLLCLFLLTLSHLLYWNLIPVIDSFTGVSDIRNSQSVFWPAVNLGLINFTKVAATATIIKYVKYWWIKGKENQTLEREKVLAELRLLKAQVHPDFLFNTLNNIYVHAQSSSPQTSLMLLKLSDLLSYMLYECDRAEVPVEREILMMKEYMLLEKVRYNNEPEIQVSVRGDIANKTIAPFLLFPFIENSFKHCGGMSEQSWINLDVRMDNGQFSMKLTNGIHEDVTGQASLSTENWLANVQRRLSLLYNGRHELRVTTEQEMFIVFLDIQLDDNDFVDINGEKILAATS